MKYIELEIISKHYIVCSLLYFILCINIYIYSIGKDFPKKDIKLTRNRVIRICIQNTLVPPIAGYF